MKGISTVAKLSHGRLRCVAFYKACVAIALILFGLTFDIHGVSAQQSEPERKKTASLVAIFNYFLQDDAEQAPPSGDAAVIVGRGGPGKVNLNWGAVDGALSYELYVSTESFGSPVADIGNYTSYANAQRVQNILGTEYELTGLENYKLYYFVIVAQHANSGSMPLEEIVAIPEIKHNDTGVTRAGLMPMGSFQDCTVGPVLSQQDCSRGRDATHHDDSDGFAGFSFTKLDATGKSLPLSATQWACVQDNVTGLVWEIKNDDGGIHDKDNKYRWGGKGALGTGYGDYYDDWNSLVDGSNNEALCGFNDWRVPLAIELVSLNSFRNDQNNFLSLPNIDSRFFPNTPLFLDYPIPCYWSAIPSAENFIVLGNETAWCSQINGFTSAYSRDNAELVRLVRGGQ